jgi:3-phenylpropionate/trans-cinnamate dioxygenase ferredoxin reductase subunit
MSTEPQSIVIVGASLAGAKAAQTLREDGFAGRVVLVGEEDENPYERPPLSKEYLRGEAGREKTDVHEIGWYAEHDVELRLGTAATALHVDERAVVLAGGERLRYDRLILTTGAAPRRLTLPGADLDGIHYLRTVSDSDALRELLHARGRIVVVGAGWIGSEVAASARQGGCDVTVIEPNAVPLERSIGPEVGAVYRDLHRANGVTLLLSTGATGFEGDDAGHVRRVLTDDGQAIDCDAVVAGIGAAPNVALAQAAGLETDNGVLVDERLQTSVPGIFAAGDVANHLHPRLGRLRVEHWSNALHQGPAAARAALGSTAPYDRLPYFFSDQYDVGMEYTGWATSWDRVVFRGDAAAREFIAFWLKDGRVLAGMNVNVWDVTEPIGALITSGAVVDEARLADPGVPLDSLL